MNSLRAKSWKKQHIAPRLIFITILFSTFVSLITTSFQLYIDYRHERNDLESVFDQINIGHLTGITESVWVADTTQINNQLQGFLHADHIESLSIYSGDDMFWSVGEVISEKVVTREFPLHKNYNGQQQLIGVIKVTASLDNIYQGLIDRALVILISNSLKTMLVVMFMLVLFHRFVTRHLVKLADYAQHISLDRQSDPLQLEDKLFKNDEIDTVVDAINKMQVNLSATYMALKDSEQHNRLILQTTTDGIYGIDNEGRVTFINQAALDMLGYQEDELLGVNNHIKIHHSHKDGRSYPAECCRMLDSMHADQSVVIKDELLWCKDGSHFPVEYTSVPVREEGTVVGSLVTFRDVTEQQHLENLLYTIAKGVSGESGQAFFRSLTKYLSEAFQSNYAFVGIIDDTETLVNTIAVTANGNPCDNFSYILANTPCQEVKNSGICTYVNQVQEKYPDDRLLKRFDVESYAAAPLKDSHNRVIGILVVLHVVPMKNPDKLRALLDIFASRASSELQRLKNEEDLRLAAIAFETKEAICITDSTGIIMRVNTAFTETTGFTSDEVVSRHIKLLKSGRHDAAFYEEMWRSLEDNGYWQGEIWNRRKNGEIYPEWENITAVKDSEGKLTHYVATFMDITDLKRAEDRIYHLAYHDALTNLANRQLFLEALQLAQKHAKRRDRTGAIIVLGIDGFKNINDSLGHLLGDEVLKAIGHRILSNLSENETVCRLGSDEFGILLPDLSDDRVLAAHLARGTAERIRDLISESMLIEQHTLFVTQCSGITLYPYGDQDAETLLMEADTAMNMAKQRGCNSIQIFQPTMQEAVDRRLHIHNGMHNALENNEFCLYFQPQVDNDEKTVGAEVLVRWQHPVHGLISPVEFIALAEKSGLIIDLGYWVLHESCKQLTEWTQKGLINGLDHLAINVSPFQFHQADFISLVIHVIKETGVDPSLLELELTESLLIDNVDSTIEKITSLKMLGIRIAIDDFGTGYSSMAYLKQLPINKIKIDQSFVTNVHSNNSDAAIVESIINISKNLGFNVIAEGVESRDAFDFLKGKNCDTYQGYYFDKPLLADDFIEHLKI